jgi:hypothetical protein
MKMQIGESSRVLGLRERIAETFRGPRTTAAVRQHRRRSPGDARQHVPQIVVEWNPRTLPVPNILGETEQRLYALTAWRETPFFSDRERAALAWTEAITLVSETHVADAVFEEVKKYFSEKEIIDLTIVATTINMWNRMAISTRAVPGRYRPARSSAATS